MPESTPLDPLADARAQAVRRILELRGESAGDDSLDVRTLLSRVDARAGEVNAAARELSAVLPTRVEAAIERVLADDAGGVGRRLDAVHAGDGGDRRDGRARRTRPPCRAPRPDRGPRGARRRW